MKKIALLALTISVAMLWTLIPGQASAQKTEDKARVIREWKDSIRASMEQQMVHQRVVWNETDTMKLWWKVYGEEPKDGRSLWISLHGGGGTTPEVNDGQWDNQKRLYTPKEGVYVAPRSPRNVWNMWCIDEIDDLYEQLIRGMVAYYNVNPNKVYILGYSAGGDGVWRMAPRMADYWASASMMAGHPGGVSLVNLRNLPFMIWMGAEDAAYDRNIQAIQRGKEMDELQKNDPQGYIHETHIMQGMGHWMNRADTLALDWMEKYQRNPFPKKIIWRQEERVRPWFYWIEAPHDELKPGMQVEVEVEDNDIRITRCDYSSLTLYLSDEIVDLNKRVTITMNGKKVYSGKPKQSTQTMRSALHHRQDPCYACPSMVHVGKK